MDKGLAGRWSLSLLSRSIRHRLHLSRRPSTRSATRSVRAVLESHFLWRYVCRVPHFMSAGAPSPPLEAFPEGDSARLPRKVVRAEGDSAQQRLRRGGLGAVAARKGGSSQARQTTHDSTSPQTGLGAAIIRRCYTFGRLYKGGLPCCFATMRFVRS